jgi:ADP-heptose:LPS heptosyltransferase
MTNHNPSKILIVRNDKLGDFVLTLPCYALLKSVLPRAKISALVTEYTAPLAEACPHIDQILVDPKLNSKNKLFRLAERIKTHHFDVAITLYSTTRIGIVISLAGIKYRLAPATKIAQVFYNHKLTQRRSRSAKPEYEYNLDLIRTFLKDYGIQSTPEPVPPFLSFEQSLITQLRRHFCQALHIDINNKLIFVHAGSGGSTNNLSIQQYANLIKKFQPNNGHTYVLTAGPGEEYNVKQLSRLLNDTPHVVYISKEGLLRFAQHIAFADLFIAGSTGPLHIAGALNVPTAAFYTRRRSATPLRWQTLNTPDRRLAFTPPETADEMDMSQIDLDTAAREISEKFL